MGALEFLKMGKWIDKLKMEEPLKNVEILEISIVDHCPDCGSYDFSNPVEMLNGHICNHPCKIKH